jgi:hypothetical protein
LGSTRSPDNRGIERFGGELTYAGGVGTGARVAVFKVWLRKLPPLAATKVTVDVPGLLEQRSKMRLAMLRLSSSIYHFLPRVAARESGQSPSAQRP